jgi:outer membrane protein OmpA-like peptidoglycan-associated protein
MNNAGFMPIMNNLPPAVQSKILPYFQWTESEKQIHLIRFRENLEAARSLWQDTGMSFQVDETGWEDVTATPNINIDITEGQAARQFRTERVWGIPIPVTDESTSDHLQVEIVKQPSAADFNEIKRIITEHNAATGNNVTRGMIRGVRSYQGNDPGSRGSAPEGFNNLMSLESDRSDDTLDRIYSTSVRFENNESELSDAAKAALDSFFSDPMILVENSGRGIDIDLQGFASAPGTTEYNRSLVERRIAAVESYIDEKIINSDTSVNIYTVSSSNDADNAAETDLASNPATHDPATYRRVDITITREGRTGQNVFAHELGHVFGLGDEYVSSSRTAGSNARHDQLARNAGVSGGAQVANDNRMMSTGNVVGAAHYSTFADALNRLTSKRWKILTS